MKLISTRLTCLLLAAFFISSANGQQNFFRDIAEQAIQKANQKRVIVPEKYRTLQLDTAAMLPFLRSLPLEKNIVDRNNTPIITLPMPDGSVARFHVWESPMFEKELPADYPEIKTFTGQGIDDRTATIKLDWTAFGFHAMIYSTETGDVFIDPYARENVLNYISYYKADLKKKVQFNEQVLHDEGLGNVFARNPNDILGGPCIGTQLRTYRLAVACTGEYAAAVGGTTIPLVLSAMTTTMNRVNGVYEKEVAVRMVFVATQTKVIFTNSATDRFTQNDNGSGLLAESQLVIGDSIGVANYDIGHTFSTGAGGIAALGCVCVHQTGSTRGTLGWNYKARGVTGSDQPTGDGYDIDYVAHEMGHQFGGSHTFNSQTQFCSGNGSSTTNSEPGSGTTIMAYAGICGTDNLQTNSHAYFNAISFDQIGTNITSSNGSVCAVVTNTGNTAPVVNAGADYIIPDSTFFVLTGSATDANGDAMTYCWEQVNVGGPFGAWNAPSGNAPIFRSFLPSSTGNVRYFPQLSDQTGNVRTIGEIMPTYQRTMLFRLTARDNKAAGGAVCYDEATVTVGTTGKPFSVTYPTATGVTWYVNDFQTVTWNPNGTAGSPVNCANVTIQLSTNGGTTYPITLIASTPNDGSEEIQVPANLTTTARIRVMAVGNIFYDISNANFRILNSPTATFAFNTPAPIQVCDPIASSTLKTASLGSFSTAIALTATTFPAGTSVSFSPASVTPGSNTIVTLNNANTLAAGTYTVTVSGTAGAVTKTKDIQFIIPAAPAAPASLSSPPNDVIGVTLQPSFNWATVANASSYTMEISTTSDFSSITQTVNNITTLPHSLVTALSENTTYYWRVRSANICGNAGTPGNVYRFRTGVNTCRISTNVPVAISATGTPTITSTITIPAASGVTITDLNVINLQGTHTYVGELTFTLTGPNNTSVVLMDEICAPFQDFNISLDDAAASAIACPLNQGAISRPANPLSVFNGTNSAGTWTLTIRDNGTGEGGSLNGWGLNINSTTATGCTFASTPLAVTYTFTGTGNWNVASNWSSNTIPPNPLPSGAQIVINHAAGGSCTLNVSQTISAGATLTVMTGKNLVVPGTLTIQ